LEGVLATTGTAGRSATAVAKASASNTVTNGTASTASARDVRTLHR